MNPTISIVNRSKIVTSSILKRVVIPAMQK